MWIGTRIQISCYWWSCQVGVELERFQSLDRFPTSMGSGQLIEHCGQDRAVKCSLNYVCVLMNHTALANHNEAVWSQYWTCLGSRYKYRTMWEKQEFTIAHVVFKWRLGPCQTTHNHVHSSYTWTVSSYISRLVSVCCSCVMKKSNDFVLNWTELNSGWFWIVQSWIYRPSWHFDIKYSMSNSMPE